MIKDKVNVNCSIHGKRNQMTLLLIEDNDQKLWRAPIDLNTISNFEGCDFRVKMREVDCLCPY